MSSCSSSDLDTSSWSQYKSKEYNFSLKYPADWKESKGTGRQYFYVSETEVPEEWNREVNLKSNFEIVINPTKFESIEEAGNDYEKLLKNNESFQETKILKRSNITFKNQKAIQFVGSAKYMQIPMKWKLTMFHHNGNYYELCSTVLEDRYEEMLPIINGIFDSVILEE